MCRLMLNNFLPFFWYILSQKFPCSYQSFIMLIVFSSYCSTCHFSLPVAILVVVIFAVAILVVVILAVAILVVAILPYPSPFIINFPSTFSLVSSSTHSLENQRTPPWSMSCCLLIAEDCFRFTFNEHYSLLDDFFFLQQCLFYVNDIFFASNVCLLLVLYKNSNPF